MPEGLPLAVSISVAFSVDKMKADDILVKNINSPEAMGGVEEILTGKTSTLTSGDMYVTGVYTQEQFIRIKEWDTFMQSSALNDANRVITKDCVFFPNEARVEMDENARYSPNGNPTEASMLRFWQMNGIRIEEEVKRTAGRMLTNIPFDSVRKHDVVAVQHPEDDSLVRIVMKGAPEVVLNQCTRYLDNAGNISDFSENGQLDTIAECENTMAKHGLRILAYAYRDYSKQQYDDMAAENNDFTEHHDREILKENLIFAACFGLYDPLREGTEKAIAFARDNQITVRLVSGDNL